MSNFQNYNPFTLNIKNNSVIANAKTVLAKLLFL